MAWLTGINKARAMVLLATLALLLTTACWASVFKGTYGDSDSYREKMRSSASAPSVRPSAAGTDGKIGLIAPYDGAQGIHVRAFGSVAAEPDIAIISLGVESIEDTASEARAMAAKAMEGVMTVLAEAGVEDRDIQTQYFNISPRYQNVRVTNCEDEEKEVESLREDQECITSWELKLIGYSVTNQASVKIRDLDEAGTIIDQVTGAAGDLVRVNGINFSIDEPGPLQDEARSKAIAAMQLKAEMMAENAGLKLGRLIQLQEASDYFSAQPVYTKAALASAESAADTSISAGEVEISAQVSGVYLIAE